MMKQALTIEPFELKCLKNSRISLNIARADRIHPLASGNKIYKLKPIIDHVKANNINQIISFGGAFSNHIHALALMGKANGIQTLAYIRGESSYADNPTLTDARNAGMELVFLDRKSYQRRDDSEFLKQLQSQHPQAIIIGEGGNSSLAVTACKQLTKDINSVQCGGTIAVASGTGTTAAGMALGLNKGQGLRVYNVLKDESCHQRIIDLIDGVDRKKAIEQKMKYPYHVYPADFGGYAKLDKPHLEFILMCLAQTGVLLDPIYTSKMCRALVNDILVNDVNDAMFKSGQTITMLHSGGLQGWRGMQKRVIRLGGESAWLTIENSLDLSK